MCGMCINTTTTCKPQNGASLFYTSPEFWLSCFGYRVVEIPKARRIASGAKETPWEAGRAEHGAAGEPLHQDAFP
ncbi:hypothetical protein E2C01_006577 [Portunus trituberculatus]|uniref:Uncharacterized protein n=1 Tax=Portunus trituberculatus TaxID=210409 RepID=A0A5B7CWQ5_PORTR|nr:hypothetical protein [Portunus trituberculatus]